MQTFLPLPDFAASANVLDNKRLGKQRVEVLQLLNIFGGWRNHPARKMWNGYQDALVAYGLAICTEWTNRGFNDTCYFKIMSFRSNPLIVPSQSNTPMPSWIGNEVFHASHRGNLLRKDPVYYGKFGWTDSILLPYIWPRPR